MARKMKIQRDRERYRKIEIYSEIKISRQRYQDREIDKKEGIERWIKGQKHRKIEIQRYMQMDRKIDMEGQRYSQEMEIDRDWYIEKKMDIYSDINRGIET